MTQELILIGDKVLIEPDSEKGQTEGGLYLPQGVKEKEKVQKGTIIKIGPGYPVLDPQSLNSEPWSKNDDKETHYFPLQAREGDQCLFLKDQGYEVVYKKKKYFVVPHLSILIIIRNSNKIAGVTIE